MFLAWAIRVVIAGRPKQSTSGGGVLGAEPELTITRMQSEAIPTECITL
jgi:hypothetical protein